MEKVETLLGRLVRLGPSMKVWGRVLCLVRPDVFCTVSSDAVRTSLAETLGTTKKSFESPDGYVSLVRMLHSSPWFDSRRPKDRKERAVWERRVALLDAIFWRNKRRK